MEKGILTRVNDIDTEVFKCLQFFQILNVFLENKGETNEDCSNAKAISEIAFQNLEKAHDELDQLISDLHINFFAK